jgi:hypothetical protein
MPDRAYTTQEHRRFFVNLISGLIAYCYLPKKPSLNLEVIDPSMALTF